jgi:hypothetical protein|tara:strand:+ start:202 stop:498 length:297 start_codon:yes stop_codon:yes gene_type:complete
LAFSSLRILVASPPVVNPTCGEEEMEASSAYLMFLGVSCLLLSWALLLITAWKEDYAWGMFSLLLPPVGYGYALFRFAEAKETLLLASVGWLLVILGL